MKHALFSLLAAAVLVACHPGTERSEAIDRQVAHYPLSSLQDVYKSFYQDRFGPGHMITDTAAFNAYSLHELAVAAEDTVPNPYYEPVGAKGQYIRVYLRCVHEGLITKEQLFDAFLRSAVPASQPRQSWADEWGHIEQAAQAIGITATDEERQALLQAAQEQRAVHHSDRYRNAYHPHYRIIEKTIFENELLPHLPYSAVGAHLLQTLNDRDISLVVSNHDSISYYAQPRVNDLMHLVTTEPQRLQNAIVADKRIGNAAATLIAFGGVREVHTNRVTHRGKQILRQAGVQLVYTDEIDFIYNRDGSGQCPMDAALNACSSPQEGFDILRTQFYP